MRLEKLFGTLYLKLVIPIQRGTHDNISIEQLRPQEHRVNCKEAAERVSREDAIGMDSVLALDIRNQFRLYELEEFIRAAARGKRLHSAARNWHRSVGRREVARAVCVRDADDNHLRDARVACKEGDGRDGVTHLRLAV